MTQEEYAAKNAAINANYKKEQLRLQRAIECRKEELCGLTKKYLEEKALAEKAIQEVRVAMAEITAQAAQDKAVLNNTYVESLKKELND